MMMKTKGFSYWNRATAALCAAAFCTAALWCAPYTAAAPISLIRPAAASAQPLLEIEDQAVPLAGGTFVRTPDASGTETYSGGGATIDASNSSEGYVMVRYDGGNQRVKLLIQKSGGAQYQYDIKSRGSYETFPLTGGSGTYILGIYTNVSGNQYATAMQQAINVNLTSAVLPFLYPSQYVNFNAGSAVVAKGTELASGAQNDLAIVENVYNYVVNNIRYDTAKANTIVAGGLSGYLPAVDSILASGKGICFDYAAVMASMLRSQQIPTRMEVGYVSNGAYHAWISTYIQDEGWVNGIIQFDGKSWKLMDPTFASSANNSVSIQQYIGNGSNYRVQYVY